MDKYRNIILCLLVVAVASCEQVTIDSYQAKWKNIDLISVKDGIFYKGQQPYYFIGANYWYGPLIGSAALGDRQRLIKELDLMKEMGIDNLRILVGAEGDGGDSRVQPALQYEEGVYNEDLLEGLDYLIMQMRKRDMYAILYMNNNWIWSGGMSQYLEWNGYGEVPNPFLEQYSWPDYMKYTAQFHSCESCMDAYYNHVKFIMGRVNKYTGIEYTKDNTIMSWQVANEPRVFYPEHEGKFTNWLNSTVKLIESIDSVHLISTGAEGSHSYLEDLEMFERLHANTDIDYLTMHMWPKNWGWYDVTNEKATLDSSILKGRIYMNPHIEIAERLNKPIVMSEFGFPRDNESLSPMSAVSNRDSFYQSIINEVIDNQKRRAPLAGLNFWGFGGYATNRPEDGKWRQGDDFSGDPPQEPQGLNSVFASDTSTLKIIQLGNEMLQSNSMQ